MTFLLKIELCKNIITRPPYLESIVHEFGRARGLSVLVPDPESVLANVALFDKGHRETDKAVAVTLEENEFSERLGQVGPKFRSPGGTGLGFDDLLEKLPWKRLR